MKSYRAFAKGVDTTGTLRQPGEQFHCPEMKECSWAEEIPAEPAAADVPTIDVITGNVPPAAGTMSGEDQPAADAEVGD